MMLNPRLKLSYILFSVYVILYGIFSFTITKLTINPIVHRVTYYNTPVTWTITGSLQYDLIITSILFSTAVLLTFKKAISLPLSIGTILGIIVVGMLGIDYVPIVNLVFILTMPILVSLLVTHVMCSKISSKKIKFLISDNVNNFRFQQFLWIFFLTMCVIESISFTRWVISPFMLGLTLPWTWRINTLENNLFYTFGLVSVYLMIFSIISFTIRPYLIKFAKRFSDNIIDKTQEMSSYVMRDENLDQNPESENYAGRINKRISTIFNNEPKILLIVCSLAVIPSLLSLYSYAVNPTDIPFFGTDIPEYLKWLSMMNTLQSSPSSFIHDSFINIAGGSRPLSLFIMYYLPIISNQTEQTVLKYLPVVLGPALVMSVYYLTRVSYPNKKAIAVIASIMTAVSHQVIIGFYAAYYANWMALITMSISIIFLFKSLNNFNKKNLTLFTTFAILTLFFHSYVWNYYIAVLVLFLTWSAIQKRMNKESLRTVIILGIITLGIIAVDLVESHAGNTGESFVRDLSNKGLSVGVDEFAQKWKNLNTTFIVYLGGFLTNSAVLLLVFLWTLKANYQNNSDRFFLSMLFVSLIPILFGDFVVQSRILYNIPLQIPASVMMYKIYSSPKIKFGKPLLVAIILMQFNYALRAMDNMYYVAPPS